MLVATLGVYSAPVSALGPRPEHADQAVLIDLAGRRFYFFLIEIWPQEVYYITGLLILAAIALFLMNAVAGRVWCGYLCPQTVWTDLFYAIERFAEGDRREHVRRDRAPWSVEKVGTQGAQAFSLADGGVVDRRRLGALLRRRADLGEAIGDRPGLDARVCVDRILTFTTYTLAGHLREQVCLYMCPWPRIQAALTDEHALNVTYRYDRGEQRGSVKKNAQLRQEGLPAGDCVDCLQCVNVCPTGVDIRRGRPQSVSNAGFASMPAMR